MRQPCKQPPDPVADLLADAEIALMQALGDPDPARRAAHLAELARLVAGAQAAHEAATRPDGAARPATRPTARE